jgi:hypothetical protein
MRSRSRVAGESIGEDRADPRFPGSGAVVVRLPGRWHCRLWRLRHPEVWRVWRLWLSPQRSFWRYCSQFENPVGIEVADLVLLAEVYAGLLWAFWPASVVLTAVFGVLFPLALVPGRRRRSGFPKRCRQSRYLD